MFLVLASLQRYHTILKLSQVNHNYSYAYTPGLSKMYCCSLMCIPVAICAQFNACMVLASGVWIRSGGPLSDRYRKGSKRHCVTDSLWPTAPFSSIYLWPVKNDISSWRASISICILLEAQRFRAEDISALSRQN